MSETELAASYFDPVAARHGLARTSLKLTNVVYRRDSIVLTVWFYGRDCEFDVVIGRGPSDQPQQRFSLWEILQLRGVGPTIGYAAYGEERQRIVLAELARLTDENTAALLAGDDTAFAEVGEHQRRRNVALSLEGELTHARNVAQRAWNAKDYSAAFAALVPVAEHLSAADRKRLEYCRKRVGG